jgi:Dolichyl-phosphate-mannose-protein mannosyltransferase
LGYRWKDPTIANALLILQNPGLQYDEALLVLGSVHMRHSRLELALPHDPDTWIGAGGRSIPLMTARYVGAGKEYICLALFTVFGPGAAVLRIASALLGLFGIWGVARLAARQVSPAAGAALACALAMSPSYLDLTVFDNGTVSIWMASMGLLCLAVSRYLRVWSTQAAFWLGAAAGFGVWSRANFLWLIGAMAASAMIVLKGRISAPRSHWMAGMLGGLMGGAPFLLYQIVSGGGTWQTFDLLSSHLPLRQLLPARFIMLAETLISDREHRAMWAASPLPFWQRWLFLAIVLAACLVCLFAQQDSDRLRARWTRGAALCFLFLTAILFQSRMPIAEHHMIVLVPLAAFVTVLASSILARHRLGRVVAVGAAALYFGCAIYWQVAAVRGLWNTGGVGQWSDAVFDLAEYLQQHYPQQKIQILDWGLQNNLYLLSDGRIQSREIYEHASAERDEYGRPWIDRIRQGGVFLLNGPENRQFPSPSLGFLEALKVAGRPLRRLTVRQRNDVPYAEIVEVLVGQGHALPSN